MKRIPGILTFTICFLVSILCTSSVFAQKTFGLSVADRVTPEQVSLLQSHGLDADQISDFQSLVSRSAGKVEISFDKTMNIPDYVNTEFPFPPGITEIEEQGYHYFEQFRRLYKIRTPREELRPVGTKENRYGQRKVRYQQYYRGIKVLGAEMIVHVKSTNRLWFMQGKYVPGINISITPLVEITAVPQIVENDFITRKGADMGYAIAAPESGILNPWVYDRNLKNKNILIWVVIVTQNVTGRTWTYYINADNGQVLDVIDSARHIDSEIWDRQNTLAAGDDELWYIDNVLQTIPGGTLGSETTDLNGFVTGYWNYLFNRFGVYSINSLSTPDGMQLVAHAYSVDMTCPNACWDCINNEAIFCQNMVVRDVVSHEFTHGLVEQSGGTLLYQNQSGALNESFADVFGEFLDVRAGATDWLHGTNRDLSNPLNRRSGNGQDPDYVGETGADTDHPIYWPHCDPSIPGDCSSANDRGGVHHNSGVPNIVAYLLVNGTQPDDPHYNYHIRAIGLNKAEQLYYSTLVDAGLTSSADFTDARNVMVSVCNGFAGSGTHGFTTNDCCQVRTAWRSVGVGTACNNISGIVSGSVTSTYSPYFVTGNASITSGFTLTVGPDVDIYFFPNTKIEAFGLLDADGTLGDIRLLSSRGNKGMRLWRQFQLRDGGEYKIPINTFGSTDTLPHAITIRDNREISSFIRVDNGFTVADVNLTLNINHTCDSNLTVTLESPNGTSVIIFSGIGGTGDNFINTVLDDEASSSITTGTAPFTGTFQPVGNLSSFDTENTEGYWRLRVQDGSAGDTGTLESWSITFNE